MVIIVSKFLDDCYEALQKQADGIAKTLTALEKKEMYSISEKDLFVFLGAGDSYAVAEFGEQVFLSIGKSAVSLSPHEIERLRFTEQVAVIGITASGRSLSTIRKKSLFTCLRERSISVWEISVFLQKMH